MLCKTTLLKVLNLAQEYYHEKYKMLKEYFEFVAIRNIYFDYYGSSDFVAMIF